MTRKVEDSALVQHAHFEVATCRDQLVAGCGRHGGDLTRRRDDHRQADHVGAFLIAGLGGGGNPGRIMVRAGLKRKLVMEAGQLVEVEDASMVVGCVVADKNDFCALKRHDAVGFWPTAVVADAHTDDAAQRAPDRKAEIAWLEIALFQMLRIGAAIAAAFLEAGASVTVTGGTEAELADSSLQGRPSATLLPLDVRDRTAVDALVSSLPALDVVVNCAGIIRRGGELDPDVFTSVVDINLNGSMRVCAAARPLLAKSSQGAIVNMVSVLTFQGGGLVPGYAASKGWIGQMTKSLAIAYASDSIRVNAVAPGWITTSLTQDLQDDPGRSEAILARTAMKRWGRPEDVVGGVLFLASPAAAFVTGVILPIDGGYLIT